MRTFTLSTVLLAALLLTPAVQAQVIISEIMYNPDSYEGGIEPDAPPNQTEWLEIYNTGDEAVSLAGWYLADEDGQTVGLPESATIQPGEAVVLIPGVQDVAHFRAAWGTGFQVFSLDGWAEGEDPLSNLANGPSETNEILTLRNADDDVIDRVNYDDESQWPSDSPDGASIALEPGALTAEANDEGASWSRSEAGEKGARNAEETDDYSDGDVGSPGTVPTE